jgi:hypothetical protein
VEPKSAKRLTTKLVEFMELNITGIEGTEIGYKLKLTFNVMSVGGRKNLTSKGKYIFGALPP